MLLCGTTYVSGTYNLDMNVGYGENMFGWDGGLRIDLLALIRSGPV